MTTPGVRPTYSLRATHYSLPPDPVFDLASATFFSKAPTMFPALRRVVGNGVPSGRLGVGARQRLDGHAQHGPDTANAVGG